MTERISFRFARKQRTRLPFTSRCPMAKLVTALRFADPDAAVAQFVKCSVGAVDGFAKAPFVSLGRPVGPDVNVVNENNVDLVHAKPLIALLQRTHGAVVAVVVDRLKIEPPDKRAAIDPFGTFWSQPAADFRGEHKIGAWFSARACPNRCSDNPYP